MIIIAGAGIAGLSLAWELACRGADVSVFDAGPIAGQTSGVATSYLEPRLGDTPLRHLERRALSLWPRWAEELERVSGRGVHFHADGQLRVALAEDGTYFEKDMAARTAAGWKVEATSLPDGLFSDEVSMATFLPKPCRVDGQAVCAALASVLRKSGTAIWSHRRVAAIERATDGLRVIDGEGTLHEARAFVLATGMGEPPIPGLPVDAPKSRPVRGINVEYALADLPFDVPKMIKHRRGYLCPRSGGRLWVGTTYEHGERDLHPSQEAVARVIENAAALVPALAKVRPAAIHAGLRAKCADGSPVIDRSAGGLPIYYSMGHGGSGFLRAPAIASDLADQIFGDLE